MLLKPFHLCILRMIAEGGYAAQIAGKLRKTQATAHYHIKRLEKDGFIEERLPRSKPEFYDLTGKGKKALEEFCREYPKHLILRAHSMVFSFPLNGYDKDKLKESEWLKEIDHSTWVGYSECVKDYWYEITPERLRIYVPKIYSIEPNEIDLIVLGVCKQIREKVIRDYPFLRIGNTIRIESQHIAVLGDILAKEWINNRGAFLGKGIAIDESIGSPEIEFTDRGKARLSVRSYLDFIESDAYKELISELKKKNAPEIE